MAFWCQKVGPVAYINDVIPWKKTSGLAWISNSEWIIQISKYKNKEIEDRQVQYSS